MQHLRQQQSCYRRYRHAKSQDQLQPVATRQLARLGEQVCRAFGVKGHAVRYLSAISFKLSRPI
jgi:hypothetical protein